MWDFFENLHLGTQNGPIFGHSSVNVDLEANLIIYRRSLHSRFSQELYPRPSHGETNALPTSKVSKVLYGLCGLSRQSSDVRATRVRYGSRWRFIPAKLRATTMNNYSSHTRSSWRVCSALTRCDVVRPPDYLSPLARGFFVYSRGIGQSFEEVVFRCNFCYSCPYLFCRYCIIQIMFSMYYSQYISDSLFQIVFSLFSEYVVFSLFPKCMFS